MRIKKFRSLLGIMLLLTAALVGRFVFHAIAKSKVEVENVPPAPPQIVTDVVQYDLDLLKITSNWPEDFTVENISDKEISGFEILIFAANDDGGPGEFVRWGTNPNHQKQARLFKPMETMTLPITPQAVKKFQDNGKPFLYVEVFRVWVNNDPKFAYTEGALLQQDQKNPKLYHVIRDSKGRNKSPRNHVLPPHITHSIKPPFPIRCCNRDFLDSVTFNCGSVYCGQNCQIENTAYTYCTSCCAYMQVNSYVNCFAIGGACPPALCDQREFITHNTPCDCCDC